MKKIISFAACAVMILVFAACSPSPNYGAELDDLWEEIEGLDNETAKQSARIAELEDELERVKGEQAMEDGFVLTVAAYSTTVTKGDTINVYAELKNRSGKAHDVASYSSWNGWDIPRWGYDTPAGYTSVHQISMHFGKDCSIPFLFNITVQDQIPGKYELNVFAFFYLPLDETHEVNWLDIDEYRYVRLSKKIIITVE